MNEAPAKPSLHDRFFAFCRQYPGAMDIDATIDPSKVPAGVKIADFLFESNTIVCEIKTLSQDTSKDKLVAIMKDHGIGPDHLQDGEHNVKTLFFQLDDGEAKYMKAFTLITTPIAGLDDAQKQIRDTKAVFGIDSADGLLVILNDHVEILGQSLFWERIADRLAKTKDDGTPYHDHVNQIIQIGEKYMPGAEDNYLNFSGQSPLIPEHHGAAKFAKQFMAAWAEFNGQGFFMAGPEHEKLIKESELVIKVCSAIDEPRSG